jgi:MFS family permease
MECSICCTARNYDQGSCRPQARPALFFSRVAVNTAAAVGYLPSQWPMRRPVLSRSLCGAACRLAVDLSQFVAQACELALEYRAFLGGAIPTATQDEALGLDAARVGLVLSVGPLVAALTAVPAGRLADRFGAQRMTIVGLIGMAAGSFMLCMMPATLGIAGFIVPIVVITAGYGLFQTANNTASMTDIRPDQRGVISGMLNLSRNLGRITGASVMGAVFAFASATTDIITARPEAVATGMRITFAVAAILIVFAPGIAVGSHAFLAARVLPRKVQS